MPRCPTCKRPLPSDLAAPRGRGEAARTDAGRFAPFCSQRCKLADLHGWLSGSYVVSEQLPLDESQGLLSGNDE